MKDQRTTPLRARMIEDMLFMGLPAPIKVMISLGIRLTSVRNRAALMATER